MIAHGTKIEGNEGERGRERERCGGWKERGGGERKIKVGEGTQRLRSRGIEEGGRKGATSP